MTDAHGGSEAGDAPIGDGGAETGGGTGPGGDRVETAATAGTHGVDCLVVGDSVPPGERTEAPAWPRRLPALVDGIEAVAVEGGMGTALVDLVDRAETWLDEHDPAVVLVHAGHNDAQYGGGEPRVTLDEFRAAATDLDAALAGRPGVARHAFVGLVPLLPGVGVPFDERQPGRSLTYDDALADAVGEHVPVARPVEAWRDRTEDGVHPNDAGHAFVAERVATRLRDGDGRGDEDRSDGAAGPDGTDRPDED